MNQLINNQLQSLQSTVCGVPSFQRIFDYVNNKIIDLLRIDPVPTSGMLVSKKWYKAAEGVLYEDSTSDTTYNYSIIIILLGSQMPGCTGKCNSNPVKYCYETCPDTTQNSCIVSMRVRRSDNMPIDADVPNTIIDESLSTLPIIVRACAQGLFGNCSCTGIWDSCTIGGIPNKYLIIGGGAIAAILLIK